MKNRACKILFVEDDPDIRTIVDMALSRESQFRLSTYASAEDALRHVTETIEYFDVGLFNVRLSGIDGPELAKRLRKMPGYAHLKVIYLTASILAPQIQHYEQQGAVGVIGKPFDPIALPGQVRNILRNLGEDI